MAFLSCLIVSRSLRGQQAHLSSGHFGFGEGSSTASLFLRSASLTLTEKWKQLGYICVFGGQESSRHGTSLVVQWLRILLAGQGAQVRSLLGELRSHMQRPQATTKATKTQRSQINFKKFCMPQQRLKIRQAVGFS